MEEILENINKNEIKITCNLTTQRSLLLSYHLQFFNIYKYTEKKVEKQISAVEFIKMLSELCSII